MWILNGTGDVPLTIFIVAAMSLVAAMLLGLTGSRRRLVLPVVLLVVIMTLTPVRQRLYGYRPAPEKGMAMILSDPSIESEITWSRWGYLGRLDVLKPGKGIENFRLGGEQVGRLVEQGCKIQYLFASGGNWTKAIDFGDNDVARKRFVRLSRHSLAYLLTDKPAVLNIGFGGGVDIFLALAHDAKSVVGVEINPLMVEAGRTELAGYFDDFYNDPRVTIRRMDGRAYVRNTERKFDVVSLTAVDTGELLHSNAHVLLENYLYTHEAFEDYMNVLTDDGFLYVSRPYVQTLRTITTAVSALRKIGAQNPERHIAVLGRGEIARGQWRSALISKKPFTAAQMRAIAQRYQGQLGYLPELVKNESMYFRFFGAVAKNDEERFLAGTQSNISPVWDDRPFFYEFGRSLRESIAGKVLWRILRWVSAIAAVLILIPMFGAGLPGRAGGWRLFLVMGYFAAIGAGFMFIEIGMIQKLVLFLGHPSYSVTVTLFSILMFSGLGSMFAKRFDARRPQTALVIWAPILAAALFYAGGLGAALGLVKSDSIALRVLLTPLFLAPGSFFMGMPFPTMIRLLENDEALIPWAWAINAFTSVAASVVTVLVALRFGFTSVMFLGAAFYVVALLFFLARIRLERPAAV